MTDLIEAGGERPRRRWPAVLVVAVLLAAAALQVPGLLEARDERREQDRREATVRLEGLPEGSGSRAAGTALLAYRLTNAGPLPLRLVLLRLHGGALSGEQRFSTSAEPLLPGASRSVDVTVTSAHCPDAVSTAPATQLEAVVETSDGVQRTATVPRIGQWWLFGRSLVDTARFVCDRPSPASAADPLLLQLRVTGDVARAVLVLNSPKHPVSLVRLVSTGGLAWSTPLRLPLRLEAGQEVRVPVEARRGDCRLITAGSGPGSLGFELTVESAPGDSYIEPPEIISTTPGDLSVTGDRLGELRDRLCGVTRS